MTELRLSALYQNYIDCLNRQDWTELGRYVDHDVEHNGRLLGLSGYRQMLEKDFREIPDLQFNIQILTCEPPYVAVRLLFECTPKGRFLGLDVDGRRVSFTENVFYKFGSSKIVNV